MSVMTSEGAILDAERVGLPADTVSLLAAIRRGRPIPKSEVDDPVEQRNIRKAKVAMMAERDESRDLLQVHVEQINAVRVDAEQLSVLHDEWSSRASDSEHASTIDLVQSGEELEDCRNDLLSYQIGRGISRDPIISEAPRLYKVSLYVGAGEALLNGGLVFMRGGDGGLMGGLALAITVSIVNASAGAVYASLSKPLREPANNPTKTERITGSTVGVLAIGSTIVGNLWFRFQPSQYRLDWSRKHHTRSRYFRHNSNWSSLGAICFLISG